MVGGPLSEIIGIYGGVRVGLEHSALAPLMWSPSCGSRFPDKQELRRVSNPLSAHWRSSQSGVAGVSGLWKGLQVPFISAAHLSHPRQTAVVTHTDGSFNYKGGVRHSPGVENKVKKRSRRRGADEIKQLGWKSVGEYHLPPPQLKSPVPKKITIAAQLFTQNVTKEVFSSDSFCNSHKENTLQRKFLGPTSRLTVTHQWQQRYKRNPLGGIMFVKSARRITK